MLRPLTAAEVPNMIQLGVNLLALDRAGRSTDASLVWTTVGFDQCSTAIALANSTLEAHLPHPEI